MTSIHSPNTAAMPTSSSATAPAASSPVSSPFDAGDLAALHKAIQDAELQARAGAQEAEQKKEELLQLRAEMLSGSVSVDEFKVRFAQITGEPGWSRLMENAFRGIAIDQEMQDRLKAKKNDILNRLR